MENKQIEEMAKVMHERAHDIAEDPYGPAKLSAQGKTMPDDFAEALYNAGYRRVSEVARGIFEEIENNSYSYGVNFVISKETLAELKKKYTESEDTKE